MISITRLQSYLRESARQHYEAVRCPPFTLFIHPTKTLHHFNYAIPDKPVGGNLSETARLLRSEFAQRGRRCSFEFVEAFAPDLGASLRDAGFVETSREVLMICTPRSFRAIPTIPGLTLTTLTNNSPLDLIRTCLETNERGFDPGYRGVISDVETEDYRKRLTTARAFLAQLDGQPVGAGILTAPSDGLTELVGIATIEAYRRQGVATALTAHAASVAVTVGVEVAFLTAASEGAGRIYKRVGFRPYTVKLGYSDPGSGSITPP